MYFHQRKISKNTKMSQSEKSDSIGPVKISDFLDFLNISFQVTDAITNQRHNGRNISFSQLDFEQLQQNELISSLLARVNAQKTGSPTNGVSGESKVKAKSVQGEETPQSEKKCKSNADSEEFVLYFFFFCLFLSLF